MRHQDDRSHQHEHTHADHEAAEREPGRRDSIDESMTRVMAALREDQCAGGQAR